MQNYVKFLARSGSGINKTDSSVLRVRKSGSPRYCYQGSERCLRMRCYNNKEVVEMSRRPTWHPPLPNLAIPFYAMVFSGPVPVNSLVYIPVKGLKIIRPMKITL